MSEVAPDDPDAPMVHIILGNIIMKGEIEKKLKSILKAPATS
jgi:hypothetical protein